MQQEAQKIELKAAPEVEESTELPAVSNQPSSPPPPPEQRYQTPKSSLMDRIRMMPINQAGVICICLIVALLIAAASSPVIDPEAEIHEAQINARLLEANNLAAKREQTLAPTDATGWRTLGYDYLVGNKVAVDRTAAVRCFKIAAAQGDERAAFYLNRMKHTHKTFEAFAVSDINPISASQTAKWADSGDVDAIWMMLRIDPSMRSKYLELMRKAARSGDVTAKYVLGYGYAFHDWPEPPTSVEPIGTGSPPKDLFFEGIDLLKEAANEGYTPAAAALGDLYAFDYADGNGLTQWAWNSQKRLHHELAIAWKRRALLQGSPTVALNWVKKAQMRGQYNYDEILKAVDVAVRNSVLPQEALTLRAELKSANDDDWGAFQDRLAVIGSTPETFATDLDKLEAASNCCEVRTALREIATALEHGAGVPEDHRMGQKVMLKRAENGGTIGDYIDAAQYLIRTESPVSEIEHCYRACGTSSAMVEFGQYLCTTNDSNRNVRRGIEILETEVRSNPDKNWQMQAAKYLGDVYFNNDEKWADSKKALKWYKTSRSLGNSDRDLDALIEALTKLHD